MEDIQAAELEIREYKRGGAEKEATFGKLASMIGQPYHVVQSLEKAARIFDIDQDAYTANDVLCG